MTLVNGYFEKSDAANAYPILMEIAKYHPEDNESLYKLGLAAMFTSRKEEAKKALKNC